MNINSFLFQWAITHSRRSLNLGSVKELIIPNTLLAGLFALSSAMPYRFYFLCFYALLITPAICTQTFYKLAGKSEKDASVADESVPFLTQLFFTCGSNEDCAELAKIKGGNDFKEVIGQQKVNEDAVVYEKVNTPKLGKYISLTYLHQRLNCYAL